MIANRTVLVVMVLCLIVVAGALAACGGGGSPAASPGAIVCNVLRTQKYHYAVQVQEELSALSGSPAPTGTVTKVPFVYKMDAQASVNAAQFDATVSNTLSNQTTTYEAIETDAQHAYLNHGGGRGWESQDISVRDIPLPYKPADVCESIAPDINTTTLTGQSEVVNGIASHRYTIQDLTTTFFNREPDLTGSDLAANIHTLSGTIWIADKDSFVSRLDVHGEGHYANGQPLTFHITVEISDLGGDINIQPPI